MYSLTAILQGAGILMMVVGIATWLFKDDRPPWEK